MSNHRKHSKRTRGAIRAERRKARGTSTTVTVTFRHVDPTDAIRDYAQRKLAPLGKFLKRPCDAHLILSVDKYRQHGEVTVKSGRLSVTAEEETKDLYSVIDLLADKVGKQLKRHIEKMKTIKTRVPSAGEVLSAEAEPESAGT
ncbi:MAG TPA: ribosome-associated translation inhibitor RaiA [Candidatus Binataceae bacterium]|nr:ribosome-associated translation inhibitor RaiA [Candidatus Binataceae bacterium]